MKSSKDKGSILVDTKELLRILIPAIQRMNKIERMEGHSKEMRAAATAIIRHFSIAKECEEVRMQHIREMTGEYGVLCASFDICIQEGCFTDKTKLALASTMDKIQEGIGKWRTFTRSSLISQERAQVDKEAPVSNK